MILFVHEYSFSERRPPAQHITSEQSCGSSVQEAKARGYLFDMMAYGWVPFQCHNGELVSTYNDYNMSPWAFDKDLERPASEAVLMEVERVTI
ncbi:uncharacterized protein LY79DRAFT_221346 [Colletotrichum navitas]|uniref:Uncharacterized protein n=1 Tax=Colletotrichum navitas TaxID=681940 RepID=A0AAD8PYA8_9PEZI|nr:uncharacterized protein LY79DRAFT_221346 [Colletotrichum navitas]KAK1590315.1 hypothetical protein LY79DRAFT_221346 [Colletotrichum navitas]